MTWPHAPAEPTPAAETLAEKVARLRAEDARLQAELTAALEALASEEVATRARVASTSRSTSDSGSSRGSATATSRWTSADLRSRLPSAPKFSADWLDDDKLKAICAEYEQATGVAVRTLKKRNLVAVAARVHGEDFIPHVRARLAETGTERDLLGHLRTSPLRAAESVSPLAASKGEAAQPPPPTAARPHGDTLSSQVQPRTDQELREVVADLDRDSPARTPPSSGATIDCSDYRAHQSAHRWVEHRWVCIACERPA